MAFAESTSFSAEDHLKIGLPLVTASRLSRREATFDVSTATPPITMGKSLSAENRPEASRKNDTPGKSQGITNGDFIV
jgi:hypothetical protein